MVCGLAFAGLVAFPWQARPQTPAPANINIEEVPLESLVDMKLGSASLHEETVSETAAAAFVLTGDEIRLHGYRTLAEALGSVPGLFVFRDDLFSMVGFRGIGLPDDYGTRVLLLVNGHPMNDSVGLGGTLIGRDLPVPIDAVKRIEVVKGPVGSLYGPSAFLGLINVVTVDSDDRASQARAAGEASQGAVRGGEGSAVVTTRADEVRLVAAVEGFENRGNDYQLPELFLPVPTRPTPSSASVRGANASGAESAFGRLEWKGVSLTGACGASSTGLVTAAYGTIVDDHRTRLSTRNCYLDLGYTRNLSERLSLALRGSFDDSAYRDSFAYPAPPQSFGMFRDASYDRWGTGDARLTWVPSGETLVLSGLTAQYHRTLQQTWADGLPTVRQDPVNGAGAGDIPEDYASLNAYLLLDQHLSDPLRVELAATYYWHELFGSRLTPKAALVWTPGDRDVLKLIYSEGFRTPTVSEAFYEDGSSYLANPKLRPEVVDAGEAIYEHRYRSVATVTLNAFLHHYRSLIQYNNVPAPGVQNPDPTNPSDFRMQALNVGSLWLRGAEVAATVSLGRWLQAHGGISAQDIGQGGRANFPAWIANLAFSSRALWEPLALSLDLAATSRRDYDPGNLPTNGSTSVASQFLLSAGAVFDIPAVHGLSAEFRVQNLLGTSAPDPLPADSAPVTSLPKPPRTFRLGLRYQFE